jgi:hypothetical protein
MLRIFIALKDPSSSARFTSANLGSEGKHAWKFAVENRFKIQNTKKKSQNSPEQDGVFVTL